MTVGHFAFAKMNVMLYSLILIIVVLKISECSLVTDIENQKGVNVSNYCPNSEHCPEGSHVLCMYYNPKRVMGQQCNDPRDVSMTRDLATNILNIVNAIRSKVAYGKEKGNTTLPRGYGINRLKWDSELATFAQVLVNTCKLRHDLCRATKKFHNPGQTAGLVRFTHPKWMPVSHDTPFERPGLNIAKLTYATTRCLKSWYSLKYYATADMINKYPDWSLNPKSPGSRAKNYLEMINGEATHMGCGISAYTEYVYHKDKADLTYNTVQMVCNFSARPRKGQPVYTTDPPSQVGYTIRCGCPEGFEEDVDCLCNELPVEEPVGLRSCDGVNCKPAVVLLPIFTVEDAPQHKLEQGKSRRAESGSDSDYLHFSDLTENTTSPFQDNNDIFNAYEIKESELENDIIKDLTTFSPSPVVQEAEPKNLKTVREKPRQQKSISQRRRINDRIRQEVAAPKTQRRMLDRNDRYTPMDVKKRYFANPRVPDKRIQAIRRGYDQAIRKNIPHPLKQSIFSRVHKFELPGIRRNDGTKHIRVRINDYQRDVAPRKDFSYSHKLLNLYLDKKRHHGDHSMKTYRIINYYETSTLTAFVSTALPTSKGRYNFSNSQVNLNRYMVNKFHYPDFNISNEPIRRMDIKSSNEESDKKFMALLDNLEQEVNHIDLNLNEKEIFDAKIRKIYGSVVGRNTDLLQSERINDHGNFRKDDTNSNLPIDMLEDFNKKINDNRIFETEDKIKELHSKIHPGLYSRPFLRSQNSREYDEKNRKQKHCTRNVNSCNIRNTDNEDLNRPYFEEKTYKSDDENYMEQIKRPRYTDNVRSINNLDSNDMKTRNLYKTLLDNEKLKDGVVIEKTRKNIRYRNQNLNNNEPVNRHVRYRSKFGRVNGYKDKDAVLYDEPLEVNKRKLYQHKLDDLERRLHDVRSYQRRNEHERERAIRLTKPRSRDEVPIRPSVMESPLAPIYMPDRARFLHGF